MRGERFSKMNPRNGNTHDHLTHTGILINHSYGARTKHTGGYGTRRPGTHCTRSRLVQHGARMAGRAFPGYRT